LYWQRDKGLATRHCEERSDEAIPNMRLRSLLRARFEIASADFVSLAMTGEAIPFGLPRNDARRRLL